MSVIHQPKQPDLDGRLILFPAVSGVLLLVLFFRLWYVQVVKADSLAERANSAGQTSVPKLAPRGLMFDRNGQLVAGIRPEIVITAVPSAMKEHPDVLQKLASMLHADLQELQDKVKDGEWRPYLPTPIFVGAPIELGAKIAESAEDYPGIGVESQPMRFYPDSRSFAHVLGSVRVPNKDDVDRIHSIGKDPAEYVGRDGVEKAFEGDLMGSAGSEKMAVDARRRPLRVVGRDSATPGNQLVLTLDARLQKIASNALQSNGFRGAVVAVEPKTGELLCLVSNPTFDQNMFQGGISAEEWKELRDDPGKPMLNRAIYASYSPGSTFKIVTSLAAYDSGHFDPNMTVVCTGGYRLGRRFAKCLGVHGPIQFQRAIEKSCNTYFFTLGMRSGEDALRKAALDSGLGQRAGLEIGGEGAGVVPTAEWIEKNRKPPVWRGGDTLNMAIGQGELRCTPLQMADVAAMVANGGTIYCPHLVREIVPPHGGLKQQVAPEVFRTVSASPEFWALMRDALISVIESGTGQSARIEGLRWAGKTGSTEHGKGGKTHAWFVGFAPADDPKIAIAVAIEAGGHGGEVAAPIAKQIVQAYLRPTASNRASASSNP